MHPNPDTPDLLSVREAAALLHVNPRTIRNRIREGLLPARRLTGSRTVRLERRDVLSQLQESPVESGSGTPSRPSPLIDRLGTPEGRARALAVLDSPTAGDEREQRDTVALLARAARKSPLALREAAPQEVGRFT